MSMNATPALPEVTAAIELAGAIEKVRAAKSDHPMYSSTGSSLSVDGQRGKGRRHDYL